MNSRTALAALILLLVPCAAIAIPHADTPVNSQTSNELIPAGTFVRIRMLNGLSSANTKEGTFFSWVVSDDIKVGDRVVVPAGNVGWGKVVTVSPAHGGRVQGFMRLRFYSIYLTDGQRIDVAVTHASSVLDQNTKNGYAPAVEDVATMFVPYFFIIDALRKGDDMVIPKNAVFHVATLTDVFVTANAVSINATPPPSPTPTPLASGTPPTSASGAPHPTPTPTAAATSAPAGATVSAQSPAATPAGVAASPAPSPTPTAH